MNIIDRRLELSGWLERLSDEGVEVHARSVFLQGLLLMPLNHCLHNLRSGPIYGVSGMA